MAYPTFDTSFLRKQTPTYTKNTYDPYKPKTVQSGFDPNAPTKYSGAEQSAIERLTNIVKYGGYSPEQKQTMFKGQMAPIREEANVARERAQADAYSRGLGQSGVLSRGYGAIDKSVLAQGALLRGQIEERGAAMVPQAIQSVQAGQAQYQEMKQQADQFNANLRQEKENLSVKLGMHAGDLQVMVDKINATIQMDAANREVELTKIMNQFNLGVAEMQQAREIADADRQSDLWGNILGGVASIAGAAFGAI